VALSAADLQAAQFASRRGAIGGAPADAEAGRFEFRPWGDRAAARVVGIAVPDGRLSPQREQAFEALLRQAGIAAERTRLAEATREARLEAERERLRAAVLSSLSHDLRTPLASILGSVTSLRRFGASMPQADSDDLLAAIEEETQRLARYVGNLLDLTRIQAGALQTARDWIDPADAARAAVDRARRAYPETVFTLACEPSTPLVRGDAVLLEQAIFNLLDNAARFAGADGPVTVQVEPVEGCVRIAVSDAGPGIPARDLPHVFESFYRGGEAGAVAGSGLGLAVSRGMVLALGGEIEALSPLLGGRGTRMLIHLPLPGDHGGDRP
jgi:two-component system sensor histidine kinase KdpD